MSSVDSGPDQIFDVAFSKRGFSREALLNWVKCNKRAGCIVPYARTRIQKNSFALGTAVLRIRVLIFPHPGSRILDPGSKISNKREG
jgi:hypothetical protein